MTASAAPRSRRAAAPRRGARARSGRRRGGGRSSACRIRSTSANSSGPACSAMTWPSSAPSSRTSTRERVAGAGRPDPERLGGDRRRDAGARRPGVTRPHRHGTVQRTEPAPRRNLPGRNLSLRLYRDARDRASASASTRRPRRPAPASARRVTRRRDADDQLEQLRFLHEVARLATTARTWDELLETVVDGTRDALHADVSSLYLLDRDGAYLTLAATNGLDRFQIGRARVPFGEGVTGPRRRGPASRWSSPTSRPTPRFLWVRGIDQRRFVASMLSVPLTWHDQTVGVLNVQTEEPRTFSDARRRPARRGRRPARRASSRRAASSPRPRRGSRRSRRSTRRAAS